jgi:uncharacterized protein
MRSLLASIIVALLLTYVALCVFLFMRQRAMIYFPQYTQVAAEDTDFELRREDAILRGWVVNRGKPDPILYFGGNAERIEMNREAFVRMFPERSVYLLAYRGYGASDGEPAEEALVADALALFDDVQRRHPGQRISVIGRSLGSGVASQVAAQRPVDRLALATPFDSLAGAAKAHYPIFPVDWLLQERFPSAQALREFERPVLVLQAERDDVVPAGSTQVLVGALPRAQHVVIRGTDHNDIESAKEYGSALSGFMR